MSLAMSVGMALFDRDSSPELRRNVEKVLRVSGAQVAKAQTAKMVTTDFTVLERKAASNKTSA